jgi:hypothetical protein
MLGLYELITHGGEETKNVIYDISLPPHSNRQVPQYNVGQPAFQGHSKRHIIKAA